MTKKVLIVICLIVTGCQQMLAQSDSLQIDTNKIKQVVILKVDTSDIYTDNSFLENIKPEWIKKIEILKDEKFKNIYDPPPGEAIIVIYFKGKYMKDVKGILKEKLK